MARGVGGVQDAGGGMGCGIVLSAECRVDRGEKGGWAMRPKYGLESPCHGKKLRGSSRNRSPAYARE